jgi:hypothetical protein
MESASDCARLLVQLELFSKQKTVGNGSRSHTEAGGQDGGRAQAGGALGGQATAAQHAASVLTSLLFSLLRSLLPACVPVCCLSGTSKEEQLTAHRDGQQTRFEKSG